MSELILTEQATADTPSVGKRTVYLKPDGNLYVKDSTGAEAPLGAGGGGGVTDHGVLTGLTDDDHAQYLNNARGDARYDALGTSAAHSGDTSNPHSVTKVQVGLGNADNTSDVNKPVSTATQSALDAKQATLVSTINIRTINGASVLGSGDLVVAGTGGVTDHGALTGLGDDDHAQYHNDARGDARYAAIAHVGAGSTAHANVVASGAAGFMTGADKTKLDGVEASANNFTHPANHAPSIITQDASNRFVTDTEKATWDGKQAALGYTPANVANNLSDLTNAGTARTNLGLGTLATQSGTFSGTSSGTNTGDQTTITGNAGTATALQTARTIDGVSFNGSANITVVAPATFAATSKSSPVDADSIPLVDSAASNGLKKLTWANLKATLLATWKDATGGLVGLTAFSINFKNAANTFTSFMGNVNTASRLYTFPDKDGTVAMLSDVAAGGLAGFRNRIINGHFQVNQRNVSGTVTLAAGVYGHDRWKAGSSGCTYTFSTTANVTTLTITAGSLQQVIEGINLQSGTHVLSWSGTAQGKIGAGSYAVTGVTGSATGGTNLTIEFGTGTLALAQLEPGSAATTFEQRPYSVEFALCQQYYQEVGGTSAIGRATGANTGYLTLPTQAPMRSPPTLLLSTAFQVAVNSTNTALTSVVASGSNTQASGVYVGFSCAGTPFSNGNVIQTNTVATQPIKLSAEL